MKNGKTEHNLDDNHRLWTIVYRHSGNFTMNYITKYINLKTGFLGAVFLGGLVYWINLDFGWEKASVAGLKQGVYTLFFGGAIVKLCETQALKSIKQWDGIFRGAAMASIIAITAVLILHHFKGTPRPFYSSLPIIITAPLSFLVIAYRSRKKARKWKKRGETAALGEERPLR